MRLALVSKFLYSGVTASPLSNLLYSLALAVLDNANQAANQ